MGLIEAQLARSGYLSFDQMIELKAEVMGRDVALESFQNAIGNVRWTKLATLRTAVG